MKNNKELEEALQMLHEMENRQFITEFYINGDIKTFAKEFRELSGEAGFVGDKKEISKREEGIIHLWGKFQLLKCLFETKKFMNSKKDITYIGKLLIEMGEECSKLGDMK